MKNRWTDDEANTVVLEAVRLCRNDPLITIGDALYMSQKLIDEKRRKEFFTPHYRRTLFDRVEKEIKRQLDGSVPKQFPLTMTPQQTVVVQQDPPPPPPKPLDPIDMVLPVFRMLGESIGKALAEHAAPLMAEHLGKTMREALWQTMGVMRPPNGQQHNGANGGTHPAAEEKKEEPASKLPAKFDKHKICIVGFPEQFRHDLMKHYPHLDMRFVAGSAPAKQCKAVSENCEATFIMLKGSGHPVERALKSGSYVRVNGSSSDLKRILGARFPRTTSMEPAVH